MKFKRVLAFVLSAMIIMNSAVPAFAEELIESAAVEEVLEEEITDEEVSVEEDVEVDTSNEKNELVETTNNEEVFEKKNFEEETRIPLEIEVNQTIQYNTLNTEEYVATGNCGENIIWTLDTHGLLTIRGSGDIPNKQWFSDYKYDIYSVVIENGITNICDSLFYNCSMTAIVIPESVNSIGNNAFYRCCCLESVIIPNSVISIGANAFFGCNRLRNITISENVISIGSYAFSECSSLEVIIIPESVTSIGVNAFAGCSSLSTISLSKNINSIENELFANCRNLKSVILPEGIKSIGDRSFSSCSSLASINVPKGIASIGNSAFYGCSSLTSINIPEGITSIGNDTFSGCSSLTSVVIPTSVTSIGTCAFQGCKVLASINVPENITSIGSYAFNGCKELTSFDIPQNVNSIENGVFQNCNSLISINIPASVTLIGAYAFSGCSSLASINIPASVMLIGAYAFGDCTSLNLINIPNKVTLIAEGTFSGCSGLTSINIPEGITSIENNVFQGCSSLESIIIPQSVISISIGDSAFEGCEKLKTLNISENTTAKIIGDRAFYGCSNLMSLNIPKGVTSIGEWAFYNCQNLEDINLPLSVTSIGYYAFYNCSGFNSIILPYNITSIKHHAFYSCSNLKSITVPSNVTSIENDVFRGCSSELIIKCVDGSFAHNYAIKNNISFELIKEYVAYGNCGNNITWTLDKDGILELIGVGEMGEGDYFSEYANLITKVIVNEGINSIHINSEQMNDSFVNITEIILPESLLKIDDYAFYGLENLNNITIPPNLKEIGSYSFAKCVSLERIDIPKGLTTIEEYAFEKCSRLKSVVIPGSVTTMGSMIFADNSSSLIIYCYYGTEAYNYTLTYNINKHIYGYQIAYHDNNNIISEPVIIDCYYGKSEKILDIDTLTSIILSEYNEIDVNQKTFGYDITNWTTLEDGTGTSYNVGEYLNLEFGVDGNIIHLYAQWEEKEYKINYYLNDGINSVENPEYYKISDGVITLKNPQKDFYNFAGWYSDNSYTVGPIYEIDFSSYDILTELYAKWIPIDYEITYELKGGEFSDLVIKKYNVDDNTINLPIPFKAEFVFAGWFDNEDLKGNVVRNIPAGSNGDKVFFAKWIKYSFGDMKRYLELPFDEASSDWTATIENIIIESDSIVYDEKIVLYLYKFEESTETLIDTFTASYNYTIPSEGKYILKLEYDGVLCDAIEITAVKGKRSYPVEKEIVLQKIQYPNQVLKFVDIKAELENSLLNNIETKLKDGEATCEGTLTIKNSKGEIVTDTTKLVSGKYTLIYTLAENEFFHTEAIANVNITYSPIKFKGFKYILNESDEGLGRIASNIVALPINGVNNTSYGETINIIPVFTTPFGELSAEELKECTIDIIPTENKGMVQFDSSLENVIVVSGKKVGNTSISFKVILTDKENSNNKFTLTKSISKFSIVSGTKEAVKCIDEIALLSNTPMSKAAVQKLEPRFTAEDIPAYLFNAAELKTSASTYSLSVVAYNFSGDSYEGRLSDAKLKWSTSNSKIASVKVNSKTGEVVLTVKKGANGTANITAAANDPNKASYMFKIIVADSDMRLETTSLTMNSLSKEYGTIKLYTNTFGEILENVNYKVNLVDQKKVGKKISYSTSTLFETDDNGYNADTGELKVRFTNPYQKNGSSKLYLEITKYVNDIVVGEPVYKSISIKNKQVLPSTSLKVLNSYSSKTTKEASYATVLLTTAAGIPVNEESINVTSNEFNVIDKLTKISENQWVIKLDRNPNVTLKNGKTYTVRADVEYTEYYAPKTVSAKVKYSTAIPVMNVYGNGAYSSNVYPEIDLDETEVLISIPNGMSEETLNIS